jgi:hypothetical protein
MTGPIARLTGNPGHIRETLLTLAADYALDIELGGWALSLLLPRRFFLSKPELFRMEQGKRVKKINFCATNPDTLAILKSEAAGLFQAHPETGVYHFWPDRGYERTWCSCPSCRAFSPEELNRIAVNSAADVLGELYPAARLSYYENSGEQIDIQPRPNMFTVTKLPGEAGAEGEGLFWTGGPSETGEP